MTIDQKILAKIAEAGVQFTAQIPHVCGADTLFLEPEDVPAFITDKLQFAATRYGVTKEQYIDWLETFGAARCGARTARGTRCKNVVSGNMQLPIREWLRRDGGFCAVHGGESSEEGQARGFGTYAA
jgi:hypothetical protein